MEIIHQLVFKSKEHPELLSELEKSGVKLVATDLLYQSGKMIRAHISESDNIWPFVEPYVKKTKILHGLDTYFSIKEILTAEWLRVMCTFEWGYPRPEDTWVRQPHNFSEICYSCGVFKQAKPYEIAKEPRLRKHGFMSLIWAPNSLFAAPKVYEVLEENHNRRYEMWDVLIHKRGVHSNSVFQLFINSEIIAETN